MLAEAATIAQSTRGEVLKALREASAATGSDFNYLLSTAMRESSLKPSAKSNSSSASGLFQFVDQTWLGMVKKYGARHGLAAYANAIDAGPNGHYRANNQATCQSILALRNDPKVCALMAGEYANQTKSQLEARLGRGVCDGELYAAHFLGPGAACQLIELNGTSPSASAAAAFPAAAEANRTVFYNQNGSAKSVREVYDWALKQPQISPHGASEVGTTTAVPGAMAPGPARATAAVGLFTPVSTGGDSWAMFGLLTGAGSGSVVPQAALLPQAPFLLTPGVFSLLASLAPEGAQDAEKPITG